MDFSEGFNFKLSNVMFPFDRHDANSISRIMFEQRSQDLSVVGTLPALVQESWAQVRVSEFLVGHR